MVELSRILNGIVVPVMGCTEPAAIALASALAAGAAANRLPGWTGSGLPDPGEGQGDDRGPVTIEMLSVRTTRSLFKNTMAVGLPNTSGESGITLAAALGLFLQADDGLNLLKGIDGSILDAAHLFVGSGRLLLEVDERDEEIYIESRVITLVGGERHVGEAVIRGRHDGLTCLRRDGRMILERPVKAIEDAVAEDLALVGRLPLEELTAAARGIGPGDREHLLRGAAMNREAARLGLAGRMGLGVGAALEDLVREGRIGDGPTTRVRIETAAAADARMSGYEVEIMASGGSGNQGIMASIPASVMAESMGIGDARLAEALALGHLITAVMTVGAGVLGGMCGCVVKAGIGAAASLGMLLSEDAAVIDGAVNNMAGNIVGEICDGAKVGCALKLATAAGAAVESALLAAGGVTVPFSNGIVGVHALETLKSIGTLARAMGGVDRRIVEIMRAKNVRS